MDAVNTSWYQNNVFFCPKLDGKLVVGINNIPPLKLEEILEVDINCIANIDDNKSVYII